MFSTQLQTIDLSKNCLKYLPEELCLITTLTHLNVESNQLEALPSNMQSLSNLKTLNASKNKLAVLPPDLSSLFYLEELCLQGNLLEEVPATIGNLQNLRKLLLHDNCLAGVPRDLGKLKSLTELSCDWFLYTKPTLMQTQKQPEIIRSFLDFCSQFSLSSHPSLRSNSINSTMGLMPKSSKVTFIDFLVCFHSLTQDISGAF
jgi:hypothetical protein